MLNIFDDALIRFFSKMYYNGPIPVVMAGPDRAQAAIEQWMKDNKKIVNSQLNAGRAIPYPYMAVWREVFTSDKERHNPNVQQNIALDVDKGVALSMKTPKSVMANVDVNIYLRDIDQKEHFEWQVHNTFPDDVGWVDIDFGDARWYPPPNHRFAFAKILGQMTLQLDLNEFVDNSNIEISKSEAREFRLTIGATLHAYLPFPPETLPVFQRLEVPIYNALDTTNPLSTVVVTFS